MPFLGICFVLARISVLSRVSLSIDMFNPVLSPCVSGKCCSHLRVLQRSGSRRTVVTITWETGLGLGRRWLSSPLLIGSQICPQWEVSVETSVCRDKLILVSRAGLTHRCGSEDQSTDVQGHRPGHLHGLENGLWFGAYVKKTAEKAQCYMPDWTRWPLEVNSNADHSVTMILEVLRDVIALTYFFLYI